MDFKELFKSIIEPFFSEVKFNYFVLEYGKTGLFKQLLLKYSYDRNQVAETVNEMLKGFDLYSGTVKKEDLLRYSKELFIAELLIERIIVDNAKTSPIILGLLSFSFLKKFFIFIINFF